MNDCPSGPTAGPGRWWVAGVFLATLLVYACWTPRVLRYTQPPSGDQPYYLQTAISLLEDHDLNEYNNYNERASYDQFYPPTGGDYPADFPGILAPYPLPYGDHVVTTAAHAETEWYSKHGVGVPLLILPGWVVGKALTPLLGNLTLSGNGGWPGVVYEYNLLGALLAVQVFLLAWEATGVRWIALLVWATLAFSSPLMSYSLLIFPELPAALLTIYAYRRLRLGWAANGPLRLLAVGLCLACVPWLHYRLTPIVLGLGIYGLHQRRTALAELVAHKGRSRSLGLFLAPAIVSAAVMAAFNWWLCGSLLPDMQDHAGFFSPFVSEDRMAELLALIGLFVDRGWGLLTYTPVLTLAGVGLVLLGRAQLRWLALIVVPYFLVVADYQVWWGAWCPPARYLAPVTPLLALPLAVALAKVRQRVVFRGLYVLLAGLGVASMVAMLAHLDYQTADHVNMLFNLTTGEAAFFSWLQARTGINLSPLFPALAPRFVWMDFAFSWREVAPALGLMAIWLGAGLLCLLGKRPPAEGALRSTPE